MRVLSPTFCLAVGLLITPQQRSFAQSVATTSSSMSVDGPTLPDAPQPQESVKPPASPQPVMVPTSEEVTIRSTPKRMLGDQKAIWTSPLHLRPVDTEWLVPLAVTTGVLINSDQHTMNSAIHVNPDDQKTASTISTGSVVALGALPASSYLWSLVKYAPQARETGLLAGEALANSLAVNQVFKLVFRRDRPSVNNAAGHFFSSSISDSSFPSNHAIAAWSMASVVADEYPGWLTKTVVYGLAGTASISRIIAEKHFPSDVLIGSATGWLIGHYVYNAHHDFSLTPFSPPPTGAHYRTNPAATLQLNANTTLSTSVQQSVTALQNNVAHLPPDPIPNRVPQPFDPDPDTVGSTNVPMDSWIYPALERLAAMGLIPGQSISIRPWTRLECLRQLRQAEELADRENAYSPSLLSEAHRLMSDLSRELEGEPLSRKALSLESVYARYGMIAGPALADSFHFGQTWWNDYGRPLGRGSSFIAGFALRAHHGRLFFYSRQEFQHGPGNPAESPDVNAVINSVDRISSGAPFIQPVPANAAYNRQRPIELYAGLAFGGNALSLGKQELYWGPSTMGPLSFSSNAEPTYNVRFVSTRPHPLPLVPSLGTYRFDIVLGKLSGHSYPARPWYNGQKVGFQFGENLEMSFTRWSLFWGVGHPITPHSFTANIFSFNSTGTFTGTAGSAYGDRADPGDRKSNFDFRYRLPGLRRIVTLYADAYSDDDPNPIAAPRRALWNPGIYFARLPFLPHMDLRVEAASSTGLVSDFGGGHYYISGVYLDANTNKGFLLGNAIGRDSRAIEARSSYWVSSRTRVELGYRQNKGGSQFLPGGGTITDGFANSSIAISRHWTAQVFAQYERFLIPSYLKGSHNNTSGWFQLTWNPDLHLKSK